MLKMRCSLLPGCLRTQSSFVHTYRNRRWLRQTRVRCTIAGFPYAVSFTKVVCFGIFRSNLSNGSVLCHVFCLWKRVVSFPVHPIKITYKHYKNPKQTQQNKAKTCWCRATTLNNNDFILPLQSTTHEMT